MDIARAPQPKRKKYVMIGAGVAGLLLMTLALTRLEPRAPGVDRATLLIDSVSRGTLVRQVRAPGTLVPERNLFISAVTQRQARTFEALGEKNLASANEVKTAQERAADLAGRIRIAKEQLRVLVGSVDAQIRQQAQQVTQMRTILQFQQERLASMQVRAGESGVLQELPLELGVWVTPGQRLARVAQPGKLKAVLRVPESQAKDIVLGQETDVDTRNGIVKGRVMRVDPIATNGTVIVEVALEGELPAGARSDISVDGTIEIERLNNVLYTQRPGYGQPESTVQLFKLEPDGKHASRVTVQLGRASVNTIEIRGGLQPGDKVIVSDITNFDNVNRIRLQ